MIIQGLQVALPRVVIVDPIVCRLYPIGLPRHTIYCGSAASEDKAKGGVVGIAKEACATGQLPPGHPVRNGLAVVVALVHVVSDGRPLIAATDNRASLWLG